MTEAQVATRNERAESTIWVISKVAEGFSVYSPAAPTRRYVVSGIPDAPTCNCQDFQAHIGDPEWQCKHILAVFNKSLPDAQTREPFIGFEEEREAIQVEDEPSSPIQKPPTRHAQNGNGTPTAQMLIKRSLSPDGRIDSVSVEFVMPVNGESSGELKAKALRTLQLQNDIAASFLRPNGNGRVNGAKPPFRKDPDSESGPTSPNGQALSARLIDIGSANGQYGERLFISVNANGKRLRLYGTPKQLAGYIGYAGGQIDPTELEPGLRLNVPCRVVLSKSESGFITVTRVLRATLPRTNGGRQWQQSAHS